MIFPYTIVIYKVKEIHSESEVRFYHFAAIFELHASKQEAFGFQKFGERAQVGLAAIVVI